MKQYLLSVYQPSETPPPEVDLDQVTRDVMAVQAEMQDAGVWVFSAGLHGPSSATVVKPQGDDVLVTDGPYIEAKEFIGGFTVIQVPDLDAALEWARKSARATTLPIEVRPFQGD
jgi:hypothetical protein